MNIILGLQRILVCDLLLTCINEDKFQMSSIESSTFLSRLVYVKQKEDGHLIYACSRFHVTPKTSHLGAVKRIFSDMLEQILTGNPQQEKQSNVAAQERILGTKFCGFQNQITMAVLDSCPKHNMVAYLEKSEGNAEFHEIIDFLKRSSIHHALTVSPVVSTTFVEQFWTSAKSKTINNVRHITAKVAGKSVSISEASIRSDLLFDDADGIDSLPNQAIFDAIQLMGSKSTSWDQIPTNIATAVICLTSNQKYNFSKLIFDDKQLANVSVPLDHFPVNTLTSKVFSFMVKKGKHFSGKVTPLFATMLVQPTQDEGASSERPSEALPTPSPAPTSEVPHEPQTDRTHLCSNYHQKLLVRILSHSSVNKSLSGNEGDMTLQSVYDLCLSLCAQVSDQAKEIQHLKAQITKLKKQAKPVIKHHRAWLKSVSLKQRFPSKSFSKKHRVHKESVSKQGRKFAKGESSVQRDPLFDEVPEDTVDHMETEMLRMKGGQKNGTEERNKGTKEKNKGTEEHIEGTEEKNEGTEEHNEVFGDDETIAKVLFNMSQAKAVSREKEKGIDPKNKGKKKNGREDESKVNRMVSLKFEKSLNKLGKYEEMLGNTRRARIEADRLLAEKLQEQEREQFTIKERAKFPHDTIAAQRKFLAQQRSEAIRNRPPTKNQLRNQMMTYLKHVGNLQSMLN
ncbi:hypothetical protein Tco_0322606 [Tanacetum coccineum]